MAMDQAHEQLNEQMKADGGYFGVDTLNFGIVYIYKIRTYYCNIAWTMLIHILKQVRIAKRFTNGFQVRISNRCLVSFEEYTFKHENNV